MAIKHGVIVTSGWPHTGIHQEEQQKLAQYRGCLPKEPSAIFSGEGERFEAMSHIFYPTVKLRVNKPLGTNKVRVAVTDQMEKTAILNLLKIARTDFVLFTDPEVIHVVSPHSHEKPLAVYLVLVGDSELSVSIIGDGGAVIRKYSE